MGAIATILPSGAAIFRSHYLSFFTRYPVRLAQDSDGDRRNDDFVLKCRKDISWIRRLVSVDDGLLRGEFGTEDRLRWFS